MIQVNRIYLIFNRLVTKKFLVDTSDPNNIIINGKVTSIGYNQMSEQMSYVLQQLMGFFKITSC